MSQEKEVLNSHIKQPMAIKFTLTQETADLLSSMSTQLFTDGDTPYQFLPFWFKETEEKNVFQVFYLDKLPKELKDRIVDLQDESMSDANRLIKSLPLLHEDS